MDYLGLLSLGLFVGAIAVLGVRFASNLSDWQKVMTAILGATLSGVALTFADRFKYSPALACYPLGLAIALFWSYGDFGAKAIAGELRTDPNDQTSARLPQQPLIAKIYFATMATLTAVGLLIALPPAYRQVEAEMRVRPDDNVAYVLQLRQKAVAAQSNSGTTSSTGPAAAGAPATAPSAPGPARPAS